MDPLYSSRAGASPSSTRIPLRGDYLMKVIKSPNDALALTNYLVVSVGDFDSQVRYVLLNDKFVFTIMPVDNFPPRSIGPNNSHRKWALLSLHDEVKVEPYDPFSEGHDDIYAIRMELEVGFRQKGQPADREYDTEIMGQVFTSSFNNQIFSKGQPLTFDFQGVMLNVTVKSIDVVGFDAISAGILEPYDSRLPPPNSRPAPRAVLMQQTTINFTKAPDSLIRLTGSGRVSNAPRLIPLDFKFEDMGIGGLDLEFGVIFRRAFASRIFDPRLVEKLGIQHVKGILLFGPPGTGKTLIARQIGTMLNGTKPKIVNGPEILSKYVGESEASIRKLFEDAEKDYKKLGEDSPLHIIIFDELDAICKQRGSKNDGTGVGDTIVNQLLSKIDGVDQLNNVLLIGMTNRKDMIDEAMLRPGRLEVHMEIGLPDEQGRLQIIKIHTAKSRASNLLAPDVDLAELAKLAGNYSGAEIAGLVKSASSFALNRHVKVGTIASADNVNELQVKRQDFMNALEEVRPAFGISEEELSSCVANHIIPFAHHVERILSDGELFVTQVRKSKRRFNMSVLLHGPVGSGKTALAAQIALMAGTEDKPFIKLITPENMVGNSESAKVYAINKIFQDSYKSPFSVIVVDAIERLIDWVSIGPRFSNMVVQCLLVLLAKKPPKDRRLLILATTNDHRLLSELGFTDVFDSDVYVPNISDLTAVDNVLKYVYADGEAPSFNENDRARINRILRDASMDSKLSIGIKKLQLVIEMAKQDVDPVERFCNELMK